MFSSKDAVIILLSSFFLAAHFGSWVWSLDHTSLVHSLLLVTSHPLVVVLLMPILGSKIRRGHVIGASVGFFGAALTLKDIDADGEVEITAPIVDIDASTEVNIDSNVVNIKDQTKNILNINTFRSIKRLT